MQILESLREYSTNYINIYPQGLQFRSKAITKNFYLSTKVSIPPSKTYNNCLERWQISKNKWNIVIKHRKTRYQTTLFAKLSLLSNKEGKMDQNFLRMEASNKEMTMVFSSLTTSRVSVSTLRSATIDVYMFT